MINFTMTQIKRAADFITTKVLMWVILSLVSVVVWFVQDMHADFKAMRADIGGLKVSDARQDERLVLIEKVFDFSPAKHEPTLYVPNPNQ